MGQGYVHGARPHGQTADRSTRSARWSTRPRPCVSATASERSHDRQTCDTVLKPFKQGSTHLDDPCGRIGPVEFRQSVSELPTAHAHGKQSQVTPSPERQQLVTAPTTHLVVCTPRQKACALEVEGVVPARAHKRYTTNGYVKAKKGGKGATYCKAVTTRRCLLCEALAYHMSAANEVDNCRILRV